MLFSIGIEFSLHELMRLGPPATLGVPTAMILIIALTSTAGKTNRLVARAGVGSDKSMPMGIAEPCDDLKCAGDGESDLDGAHPRLD